MICSYFIHEWPGPCVVKGKLFRINTSTIIAFLDAAPCTIPNAKRGIFGKLDWILSTLEAIIAVI